MATFDRLRDEAFVSLTTFRRNGTPVPTAVWFVLLDGKMLITTSAQTGKVKRIKNRGDVTVAPSTRTGKPTGQEQTGHARIIEADLSSLAYQALKQKYGMQYRLIMSIHKLRKHHQVLIEIEPT